MKKTTPSSCTLFSVSVFVLLGLLSLTFSCGPVKSGYKAFKDKDFEKAHKKLDSVAPDSLSPSSVGNCYETAPEIEDKKISLSPNECIAAYYLNKIEIRNAVSTSRLLNALSDYSVLEKQVNRFPYKKIKKLDRYEASRGEIMKSMEILQGRIYDRMLVGGSISELHEVERREDLWPTGKIDTLYKVIVNKTIAPRQQVFATREDRNWKLPLPDTTSAINANTPCFSAVNQKVAHISYQDANAIAKCYPQHIRRSNYSRFWAIRKQRWELFKNDHSYCEMMAFKDENPNHLISQDCWFEAARDTLCLNQLKPLLAFHRNNPYTYLDLEICFQILCLYDSAASALTEEEEAQLKDIQKMLSLQSRLFDCEALEDSEALIAEAAALAQKYHQHLWMFSIARQLTDLFAINGELELARKSIATLQPLFPDTSVCAYDYPFQVEKQAWFNSFEHLLNRTKGGFDMPGPVHAWNTEEHDEHSLVSYGATDEVYFVQTQAEERKSRVLRSLLKKGKWTSPKEVSSLSVDEDVKLLSMSEDGLMMLLRANGELMYSTRRDIGRKWHTPDTLKLGFHAAGHAWISPNDSILLFTYYSSLLSPLREPKKNLAIAKLGEDDRYHAPTPISESINLPESSEGNAIMALGGRMMFYSSDKEGGIGMQDIYSIGLNKPNDWSRISTPINLGTGINTIRNENGITHFSEYTNTAYFDRTDRCSFSRDIYQIQLPAETFPDNALRLAGIVVDEHGKPLNKGFIEFTPNYKLNVYSEPISKNGTYTYTVPDSTAVVRLYPEVPGYYTEQDGDATHFLTKDNIGSIIRDTFRLTSFDHIRTNFELINSTFINGTATFDNAEAAHKELHRLADITTRMGAELEITGHTDVVGNAEDNIKLSRARAKSVKDYLVNDCGIPADKISTFGYGSTRPNCDNDTEEGRRCNRRVEIKFRMPKLE
jgi:outer membrane protein OmpA-like peptidoglycan-associated protein